MNLKVILVSLFALTTSLSFAQSSTVQTSHPRITITEEEGKEDLRIYNFPYDADYRFIRVEDNMNILEGKGRSADISGLVPGEYFVRYKDETGNGTIDRFTIQWD